MLMVMVFVMNLKKVVVQTILHVTMILLQLRIMEHVLTQMVFATHVLKVLLLIMMLMVMGFVMLTKLLDVRIQQHVTMIH